jgi:hypothetical protein
VFAALIAVTFMAAPVACTIAPKPVTASKPSLDGNVANSGLLGDMADGSSVLTPGAIERYEGLIALGYGKSPTFVPALKAGQGYKRLADGTYTLTVKDGFTAPVVCQGDYDMDEEHVGDFAQMARAHAAPNQ